MRVEIDLEKFFIGKSRYQQAERQYYESMRNGTVNNQKCTTLVSEIAKAREHIQNSLEKMDEITTFSGVSNNAEILDYIKAIDNENKELKKKVENLTILQHETEKRLTSLENIINAKNSSTQNSNAAAPALNDVANDDDDVDLFGSESEDENDEAARIREERLAAYAAKKSKKPVLIAKSSLVLDVKPWDDETDLKLMEAEIRKINTDGLLWGASKFVPVAFGIQKLSISCVVEDEKVSIDWLTEEIESLESFVQSVDVAAFNKI